LGRPIFKGDVSFREGKPVDLWEIISLASSLRRALPSWEDSEDITPNLNALTEIPSNPNLS